MWRLYFRTAVSLNRAERGPASAEHVSLIAERTSVPPC